MSIKPERRTFVGAEAHPRRRWGRSAKRTPRYGPGRASGRLDTGRIERTYDRLVAWTEGGLAVLVSQTPRPPMLTLALPDERVPAALLI